MSTTTSDNRDIERKNEQARATLNTTSDGEVLGVALFLGKDDLEALGLTNADHVQYSVENGDLQLREVTKE